LAPNWLGEPRPLLPHPVNLRARNSYKRKEGLPVRA